MSDQKFAKTKGSETKSNPRNSFFVFLQEYRQILKKTGLKGLHSTKVSKLAAEIWQRMSNDEKLPYKIWARISREQLSQDTSGNRKTRSKKPLLQQVGKGIHPREKQCASSADISRYFKELADSQPPVEILISCIWITKYEY
uniref:HMG box domain-containing protein n=1 Tax=Glossina brevipalpis TaxID=37001 RepID=A0A1A9WHL8_9MUSC